MTTYISGPNNLYIGEYDGKRYYIFGDVHGSMNNSCYGKCDKIILGTFELEEGDGECYDITRFIDLICRKQQEINKYTDVYLEKPYIYKTGPYNIKFNKIYNNDYLSSVNDTFSKCFKRPISKKCPYEKSRFHYIDLRYGYDKNKNDNTYGTAFSFFSQTDMIRTLIINNESGFVQYVYGFLTIFKIFFENQMDLKLLEIYISSMDYINDIKIYIDELKKLFYRSSWKKREKYIPAYEEMYDNIENFVFDRFVRAILGIPYVERINKIMTKIAAQFEALEYQGDIDLSNKIKNFIFEDYKTEKQNMDLKLIDKLYDITLQKELNNDVELDVITLSKFTDKPYIRLNLLIMDSYMLSRMFRTYPDSNHINSTRIITYTGRAHSEVYKNFFEKYLNVKFRVYENKNDHRCIKLDVMDLL